MPIEDAIRWNERYRTNHAGDLQVPRPFLTEHVYLLPGSGLALDVAMGAGKNTAALLERGYRVIGVDISSTAVLRAKRSFPQLWAVIADLTQFHFPTHTFDLILNFYYLQRDLWPEFRRILKPGGILVFETLTRQMTEICPDISAPFLLEEGELRKAFQDWEILVYHEGWVSSENGKQKSIASLIARLPGREPQVAQEG